MIEDPLPWDYIQRACALLDGAASVLDMDTGGGERLLEMRPHWPERVVATEEYPPNLALARERLDTPGRGRPRCPHHRRGPAALCRRGV